MNDDPEPPIETVESRGSLLVLAALALLAGALAASSRNFTSQERGHARCYP
jgi:hypothetical protein